MGEVWVAHHLALDIDVAVKFIGDEEGDQGGPNERLLEEARTTARLGHPSIVRALDFGQTDANKPFIVLELLEGEDLAALMEREGAIAAERAVTLLLPIAHALSVVHENQIVHRDVKPENVFLAKVETGVLPKLLDFGIARKTTRVLRKTARDTALGTPDYMSPQQARGDRTDASTDQWSFCVVLYEAVAGARPFEAENYNALLRAIIEQEPKSLLERGVQQPELWSLLERGFNKDPAQRFRSIRELGEALARWLLERGVNEDASGTALRRVSLREESIPPKQPSPPLPTPSPPAATSDEAREQSGARRLDSGSIRDPGAISETQVVVERIVVEPTPVQPHPLLEPNIVDNESLELPASERPPFDSSPRISEPEAALNAIAELHRGGEPVERFRRAARMRSALTFILLVTLVFGATFAILIGTGIVQF